jgi:hypothetical protein
VIVDARQRRIALNGAVEFVEFLATSYYGWRVVLIENVDEYPVVGKQCRDVFALAARNPVRVASGEFLNFLTVCQLLDLLL